MTIICEKKRVNCLCAPRSIHVAESPRDWVGGLGGWDGGGLGDRCWSGTEVLLKISIQYGAFHKYNMYMYSRLYTGKKFD